MRCGRQAAVSAYWAKSASSFEEDDAKHMLRLADDCAGSGIILGDYPENQQLRYAFRRCDLKQGALNGAVVHQAMNRRIADADRNLTGLESVPANGIPALRSRHAISIQPLALMDSLIAQPITAPLRKHDRRESATQICAHRDDALGTRRLFVRPKGMLR